MFTSDNIQQHKTSGFLDEEQSTGQSVIEREAPLKTVADPLQLQLGV